MNVVFDAAHPCPANSTRPSKPSTPAAELRTSLAELRTRIGRQHKCGGLAGSDDGEVIQGEAVTLDSEYSAHRYVRSADKTVIGFYWQWE